MNMFVWQFQSCCFTQLRTLFVFSLLFTIFTLSTTATRKLSPEELLLAAVSDCNWLSPDSASTFVCYSQQRASASSQRFTANRFEAKDLHNGIWNEIDLSFSKWQSQNQQSDDIADGCVVDICGHPLDPRQTTTARMSVFVLVTDLKLNDVSSFNLIVAAMRVQIARSRVPIESHFDWLLLVSTLDRDAVVVSPCFEPTEERPSDFFDSSNDICATDAFQRDHYDLTYSSLLQLKPISKEKDKTEDDATNSGKFRMEPKRDSASVQLLPSFVLPQCLQMQTDDSHSFDASIQLCLRKSAERICHLVDTWRVRYDSRRGRVLTTQSTTLSALKRKYFGTDNKDISSGKSQESKELVIDNSANVVGVGLSAVLSVALLASSVLYLTGYGHSVLLFLCQQCCDKSLTAEQSGELDNMTFYQMPADSSSGHMTASRKKSKAPRRSHTWTGAHPSAPRKRRASTDW